MPSSGGEINWRERDCVNGIDHTRRWEDETCSRRSAFLALVAGFACRVARWPPAFAKATAGYRSLARRWPARRRGTTLLQDVLWCARPRPRSRPSAAFFGYEPASRRSHVGVRPTRHAKPSGARTKHPVRRRGLVSRSYRSIDAGETASRALPLARRPPSARAGDAVPRRSKVGRVCDPDGR